MRSGAPGWRQRDRSVRLRRRAGLLPGLAWVLFGLACATDRSPDGFEPDGFEPPGPVAPQGPEAGPSDQDPRVEVSPLTPTEIVSRSEFRARFWDSHGVELLVRAPEPLPVLGQPTELGLVIRNHGPQELVLPMLRRRGWSFRKDLQGELVVDLVEDRFSLRAGRSHRSWRHVLRPQEDWVIPPFSEALFLVPIPSPDHNTLDLVQMRLRATLFPLSVAFEGEPESLVAVAFPEQDVTWVTAAARPGLDQVDASGLTESLLADPGRLLAMSLCLGNDHRLAVTDWLVRQLPGPDRASRAALILGLQAITGQSLGTSTARWQSWWASEAGARWAMEQRLASRENPRTP